MIKSRLIQTYLSLSKAELSQLKLWVQSPVHNQHEEVKKLFQFLASRRTISHVSVKKERAFLYCYVTEDYNEDKLNVLMSYALDLIKQFLGYNHALLNEFDLNKNMIQSLASHQLEHLAEIQLQKTKQQLAQNSLQNANKTLQNYLLEQEQFNLTGTQQRTEQTNLPLLLEHLTNFYLLSNLKYACIALSHSNVSKQSYHLPMLEVVLKEAAISSQLLVRLYYNAYQSLAQQEEQSFFYETERLFLEAYEQLDKQEQHDILLILINYCIKRINLDTQEYRLKVFEWYKWGLLNKLLVQQGKLSRFTYLNICTAALKLQELDWAEDFIKDYIAYLPLEVQENYQHYATAKLHFYKKEYTQAQRQLIQLEYDDVFLNLDAKTMLLEIYYEEKSWDALDALLVSFRRFLQRKSVMAYHKKVYQNIIYIIQKMRNIPPYDKAARIALEEEIRRTNPLAERAWLLEQISE